MQVTGNNPIHNEQNRLSIRLCANGFSFFVFNPAANRIIHQHTWELIPELSYLANLKQAVNETDFLQNGRYDKVNALVIGERYTLVPLELFDESQKAILYKYNLTPTANETIHHNLLINHSCAVLFGIDAGLYAYLNHCFPGIEYHSQVSVLTEYFSILSRPVRLKQMFVYLRPGYMDVFCFDRGFMSLVNTFKCTTPNDSSYYLLLIWKQLGMNQLTDELNLAGIIDGDAPLTELLSRFIRKITVLTLPEQETTAHNATDAVVPGDIRILLSIKERL